MRREALTVQGADGAAHVFHVELALGPLDQMHGLMNRSALASDAGMLFVFPDAQPRAFWMKDTLIPLDMLFIGRDGRINHIHANARPRDETAIPSQGPALAVLEISGGLAATLKIRAGDRVYDGRTFKK